MGRGCAGAGADEVAESRIGADGAVYRRGRRRSGRAAADTLAALRTKVTIVDGEYADQIRKLLRGLPANRVDIRPLRDADNRWRAVHNLTGNFYTFPDEQSCIDASRQWLSEQLFGGQMLIHARAAVETADVAGRAEAGQIELEIVATRSGISLDMILNGRLIGEATAEGDTARRIAAVCGGQIASAQLDGLELVVQLAGRPI